MRRYRLPLALVILAALAAWVLHSRRADEAAATAAPDPSTLLPPLQAEAITEIAIDSPRAGAVTLTRAGDRWLLTQPVEGPADPTLAESLITALSEMQAAGVAATLEKHHRRLWVDEEYGIRVRVKGGDDSLVDFVLGRYMPATEESMVRLAAEKRVIRVPGWLRQHIEHEPSEWRKKTFFDQEPDAVTAVRFRSERGDLGFTREGGRWKPAEGQPPIEPLDRKGLTDRVTALARFRGSDFAPEDIDAEAANTGEDAPVVVRLETATEGEQPATFELRIGEEAGTVKREDGTDKQMYYVQHDDDPIVYRTSKYLRDWMSPDPAALRAEPEPQEKQAQPEPVAQAEPSAPAEARAAKPERGERPAPPTEGTQ